MVLLFSSWSWSCKQRSWSWPCYIGLGLKNSVLFTSLSVSEGGITGFVYHWNLPHHAIHFSLRILKRCKPTNAVIALNFLDSAASCPSRFAVLSTNCLLRPPSVWPHLFCGAGHEKRTGEQLKWSLAFTLYIGSYPCAQLPGPIHSAWLGRVCFCVCAYCLGLCFACLFVLFDLFISPFFCVSLGS